MYKQEISYIFTFRGELRDASTVCAFFTDVLLGLYQLCSKQIADRSKDNRYAEDRRQP